MDIYESETHAERTCSLTSPIRFSSLTFGGSCPYNVGIHTLKNWHRMGWSRPRVGVRSWEIRPAPPVLSSGLVDLGARPSICL
jgi:hypothetical protein